MSLTALIDPTDDFVSAFSGLRNDSDYFVSITNYQGHSVTERMLIRDSVDGTSLITWMEYDRRDPGVRAPRGMSQSDEYFDAMSKIESEVDIRCQVHFEFPTIEGSYIGSIFPLPISLGDDDAELPFDEIRGMRLSRLGDDSNLSVMDVILDRPANDEFYATLNFSYRTRMTHDMPRHVLRFATRSVANVVWYEDEVTNG